VTEHPFGLETSKTIGHGADHQRYRPAAIGDLDRLTSADAPEDGASLPAELSNPDLVHVRHCRTCFTKLDRSESSIEP
jgi:hypothetical protein